MASFKYCLAFLALGVGSLADNNQRLWYTKPAEEWTDALPIGNGRIGAMIYGNPVAERLQVNEESVYSGGGKRSRLNPDAWPSIVEVRKLLAEGRHTEAEKLAQLGIVATPESSGRFETLGEIEIFFDGVSDYENYERWLDVETATAGVKFTVGDSTIEREMIASTPKNVIAHRIAVTDGSHKLSFQMRTTRRVNGIGGDNLSHESIQGGSDTVYMNGGISGWDPVRFATGATIKTDGNFRLIGEFLVVENATEATAYFTSTTTYRHEDLIGVIDETLDMVKSMNYEDLRAEHIEDYQALYKKCSLSFNDPDNTGLQLPTDSRINATRAAGLESNDVGLIALTFNYGRYLLIASSREGTLPANLQGIWNYEYDPSWGSKYTVNIKYVSPTTAVDSVALTSYSQPPDELLACLSHRSWFVEPPTL